MTKNQKEFCTKKDFQNKRNFELKRISFRCKINRINPNQKELCIKVKYFLVEKQNEYSYFTLVLVGSTKSELYLPIVLVNFLQLHLRCRSYIEDFQSIYPRFHIINCRWWPKYKNFDKFQTIERQLNRS